MRADKGADAMAIIRRGSNLTGNFYILDNRIAEDAGLSWEARGLLIFLLCKPTNWTISVQHLVNSGNAGRDKVMRILKELKDAGYVEQSRVRNEQGHLGDTEYVIHESPKLGQPKSENPVLAGRLPKLENPTLVESPKSGNPTLAESPKSEKPTQAQPILANPHLPNTQYYQELSKPNSQQQQIARDPLTDRDGVKLSADWQPPTDVLERLAKLNGIPLDFSLAQVGPFVSHWLAHGGLGNFHTWASGFHAWVNRDWKRRAATASYRVEDHDWSSWLALGSDLDGVVTADLIQSWLTIRQSANAPVTPAAIQWTADEIQSAAHFLRYPAVELLREAIVSGWVTIRGSYLVDRFQRAGMAVGGR